MRTLAVLFLRWGLLTGIACAPLGQGQAPESRSYRIGPAAVEKFGEELRLCVKPKDRLTGPVARDQPMGPLAVSSGLVEWINRVAHAKAIDDVQPGYFAKYFASLTEAGRAMALKELPDGARPEYWSEKTLGQQRSLSQSLVGYVLATHLAYYLLDYYPGLAWKLRGYPGPPVWPHGQLAPEQWTNVFQTGAKLNLEAGLGLEGIGMIVTGLEPLAERPDWAACFFPSATELRRLKRDIKRLEMHIDRFD
jgi:hypothetical protein